MSILWWKTKRRARILWYARQEGCCCGSVHFARIIQLEKLTARLMADRTALEASNKIIKELREELDEFYEYRREKEREENGR